MATKKNANLKLVDSDQAQQSKTWEEKQQELEITRHEMQQRVQALRTELEKYRDQLDAAPFDILNDDEPRSLQQKRKFTIDLVENLNPLVDGLSAVLDDGTNPDMVFDLKREAAETGFKIGVLAGVILAGDDPEIVAKFARGLAFDLSRNPEVIKG